MKRYIIPFAELSMNDIGNVGGKNASLGEMIRELSALGVAIPPGFAVTVSAFQEFLAFNCICPQVQVVLNRLNRLTLENLTDVGAACRAIVLRGTFPEDVRTAILDAYRDLVGDDVNASVAVRSSGTAEDSPTASFAGQHDSFLNVTGEEDVLQAVRHAYASLYNDRAIKYRIDNGFSDMQVGQSVGIQLMVRSDKGSAGVAFTLDPEYGNENVIYITGAWGLGESVVQGAVNTDEFYLFKPAIEKGGQPIVSRTLGEKQVMLVYGKEGEENTVWQQTSQTMRDQFVLSDDEIRMLGQWCLAIEKHYRLPMDIEWAKDGETGKLFVVQARPETVHAGRKTKPAIKEYTFQSDEPPLLVGKAVGHSITSGRVTIVKSLADGHKVQAGDIIVADITNPDWNALLRKAICIVTNKGGRTSHASIVARELGIPAVVGTLVATEKLTDGQIITVSCASGDVGYVYNGALKWSENEVEVENIPRTETKAMFILADPQNALLYASYPSDGVGLLRMEFTISNSLQVHPMALVKYHELPATPEKRQIDALTRHYADKKQFFVEKLSESIGLVAAAFYPREVIVRMSDFKTNEYAKLLGGKFFEPEEENPMLGFRGASRYYHARYREGFGLECLSIRKVREEMGLTNVKVMIPFCRTVDEAVKVQEVMKEYGLERGKHGLEIYVMAEIPSNILLADRFAAIFDGFSIGSNDLTQLTLGLDRDSAIISDLFSENDESVRMQIRRLIEKAHEAHVKVGLCGQAPSDYPEFTRFLVEQGIDSISFNPDVVLRGIKNIAHAESGIGQTV